jgi:hypothetical protein
MMTILQQTTWMDVVSKAKAVDKVIEFIKARQMNDLSYIG